MDVDVPESSPDDDAKRSALTLFGAKAGSTAFLPLRRAITITASEAAGRACSKATYQKTSKSPRNQPVQTASFAAHLIKALNQSRSSIYTL